MMSLTEPCKRPGRVPLQTSPGHRIACDPGELLCHFGQDDAELADVVRIMTEPSSSRYIHWFMVTFMQRIAR